MAKSRAPSKHSRAARRATSPGIDTDKSLKDIKPPSRTSGAKQPSVLAAHQSAGVQKKTKKKSQMTSKARRRHEKGLQMAEAIAERTNTKVEKSKGKGRTIQNRSKDWENINRLAQQEEQAAESDNNVEEDNEGSENEDMKLDATTPVPDETAPAVQKPADDGFLPIDEDEIL